VSSVGATLIVGGDGLIGRALAERLLREEVPVLATTRRAETLSDTRIPLDLMHLPADWQPPAPVSTAFLCAAITSLDECRRDPAIASTINVHSTVALARSLVDSGAFVVFLSTNLVFDGRTPFARAEDAVNPQTEYGRQKAKAERELLTLGASVAVVRLTKVFAPDNPLIRGWVNALRRGQAIRPFSDMVLAPVPLDFTVEALLRVATARLCGITQVSASEDITYEQMATYIADRIGAAPALVQPVAATDAGLHLESVPCYTALDCSRLAGLGLEAPSPWETVDSMLA